MQMMMRQAARLICLGGALGALLLAQPQPEAGQTSFAQRCAVCHGALGDGGSAPDLSNPQWQATKADDELARIIRDGVRGSAMPAFGDTLNEATLRALVRHIRSLSAGPVDTEHIRKVQAPNINIKARNPLLRAEQ